MKKFGRKLFLSCAALAACATTLVSTTFAWYTSNTEVALGAQSAASQTNADGDDILVSRALTYDTSGAKLTTGRAAATWSEYSNNGTPVLTDSVTLKPVYYNVTDKTYKTLDSVEDPESGANATVTYSDDSLSANVLEFRLRFKSQKTITSAAEKVSIYVSGITLTNTRKSADDSKVPADVHGEGTGISKPGDYNVDILKAIKLNVSSAAVTKTGDTYSTGEFGTVATYGFESFGADDTNVGIANAIGYYNKALRNATGDKPIAAPATNYNVGTETTKLEQASSNNAVKICEIGTTGYTEVIFVFYLDGWDNYCYNACRKQGISVALTFSSSANTSVLSTQQPAQS